MRYQLAYCMNMYASNEGSGEIPTSRCMLAMNALVRYQIAYCMNMYASNEGSGEIPTSILYEYVC